MRIRDSRVHGRHKKTWLVEVPFLKGLQREANQVGGGVVFLAAGLGLDFFDGGECFFFAIAKLQKGFVGQFLLGRKLECGLCGAFYR